MYLHKRAIELYQILKPYFLKNLWSICSGPPSLQVSTQGNISYRGLQFMEKNVSKNYQHRNSSIKFEP